MPPSVPVKGMYRREGAAGLDTGSVRSTSSATKDPKLKSSSTTPYRRSCSLWVHDEAFSREEVLFNLNAFSGWEVKIGDLVEISIPPAEFPVQQDFESSGGRNSQPGEPGSTLRTQTGNNFIPSSNHLDNEHSSTSNQGYFLFVVKPLPLEITSRHPNLQISVTNNVANNFGFKNRSQVLLTVKRRGKCSASHVELVFRDQYLMRSDMWRLAMSELVGRPLYKGQKISFLGTIKATVKSIYIGGKKYSAGYFAPKTIPVFRSESARYVLFIQMSAEMWDFDSEGTGDILFSRVINGLLPKLFKRWTRIDAHHLVTIVLFTRVKYDNAMSHDSNPMFLNNSSLNCPPRPKSEVQDFYRVVVNDMPSGQWTAILDELKREFRTFLRDVSLPPPHVPQNPMSAENSPRDTDSRPPPIIAGRPTSAFHGNILEAIHIASSYLAFEYVGRDLARTGTSIVVITPGTGVFEVPFDLLALASDSLTNRSIGIDLICLSPMPLHSVPLFKYKLPNDTTSESTSSAHKHARSPLSSHDPGFPSTNLDNWPNTLKPGRLAGSFGQSPESSHAAVSEANIEEWGYGIPHWIDISFWDPHHFRDKGTTSKYNIASPALETISTHPKLFVPKVRMYEIQMMGVMESEQSNISVPRLCIGNSGLFGTSSTALRNLSASGRSSSSTYLSAHGSSHKPQGPGIDRPGSFMYSLKDSKKYMMSAQARQRTKLLEWMDSYDGSTFHSLSNQHEWRPYKPQRPTDIDAVTSQNLERSSVRSPPRSKGPDIHVTAHPGPPVHEIPQHARFGERFPPTKTKSVPIAAKPDLKSSIKSTSKASAPRVSRSISFALLGLGRTPPTAVARTEVRAENANALPTASGKTPEENTSESPKAEEHNPTRALSASTLSPEEPYGNWGNPNAEVTPSRPISIRTAIHHGPEENNNVDIQPLDGSYSTAATEILHDPMAHVDSHSLPPPKRTGRRLDMAMNSQPSDDAATSPSKALAPWMTSVTPWNPPKHGFTRTSWFGRWNHVHPRKPTTSSVNWKGLKSPAILPLTTEEFPTEDELASNYLQTPYRVSQNDDSDVSESPRTREALLQEMIALRLSYGFQIVVPKRLGSKLSEEINIFDTASLAKDGMTISMIMGNIIHRLVCVGGGEIEVTRYTRKPLNGYLLDPKDFGVSYTPAVKTILASKYCKNTIHLGLSQEDYNWNFADSFLAGYRDHLTNSALQLRYWRTRFVLIPVQVPVNARRPIPAFSEDNEEEIHLLGIYQLTQLWQRNKYVAPEERRFQSSTKKKRGQNPLNILYQTSDPSVVVAAELDRLLLDDPGLDNPPAQLLPDSELLQKSTVLLSSLSQAIQGEKGITMMDRRWHWRLHYNCFVGIELTTWLMQNFSDIDNREEAVEFGNELMKHGLFHHVQRRHNFRDGNYFYQIADEYRVPRPESRGGWFQPRKMDKSAPNTPLGGGSAKDSPSSFRDKSDLGTDETAGKEETSTPSKSTRSKVAIWLAKSMKYDVDPRRKSNRPEIIDLHYDRLHNPENCFHIELSWLNATPKLVEDAIISWAGVVEKYGLKLVELPISEASSIVESQVFRKPYQIQLKLNPPEPPSFTVLTSTSFASQAQPDRHYYQKAILKKFDFVLDFEARSAFPADVEASYSWGRPDYRFPQYVHRTGTVLAQITDEGHFLLLANRLFSIRSPASAMKDSSKFDRSEYFRPRASTLADQTFHDRFSPHLSPIVRGPIFNSPTSSQTTPAPQSQTQPTDALNAYRMIDELKDELRSFCNDSERLAKFYAEVPGNAKPASTKASPTMPMTLDSSIPSLELPASVVRHVPSNPENNIHRPVSIDAVVQNNTSYTPKNDPSRTPRP